jgi:ABC-2 type transport system ATP-binding protein
MLCGLLTPDRRRGTCLGYDIRTQARQIKRQVGYMTQKFGLYEDLSIEENLDFVARIHDMPDRRARVDATLERLGLASRRSQLAGALSGGWKQRLALAACLLHEPRCCCSTSRPPASTPRRAANSGTRSTNWPPAA